MARAWLALLLLLHGSGLHAHCLRMLVGGLDPWPVCGSSEPVSADRDDSGDRSPGLVTASCVSCCLVGPVLAPDGVIAIAAVAYPAADRIDLREGLPALPPRAPPPPSRAPPARA